MELEAALRGIRNLHDIPLLLRAMGHRPLYEPAAVLPGRASGETVNQIVAVGSTGGFPWFAVPSLKPERAARGVARRLGQRGLVAGALALDEQGRRLAIAVGMAGTPSLVIDLAQPSSGALESLARMSGAGQGGALGYASRVADALSIESVGKRFFRAFRDVLERMSAAISSAVHADDCRDFVLLQLTRVLFLYFVQAKGWMAGRERFLGEEADRCLASRRNIHRSLLRPLFFGTLNRPSAERTHAAARFGAIPFLNGGLFEPHPLERRVRRHLPNDAWRDAFDNLFERFHFTAEAASPGRIAPDMLGRVFEGVMAPDVRRASGTYYTPAALVATIVDAALVTAVAARLGCEESDAKARLESGQPRAVSAASCLTILDPAVGSGAFLLGALERLASFRTPTGESEAARKRRVLQRNLFGVDRSGAAVRLAELRLWLAVVGGDPAERPVSVQPLPNLDCLVRQGDSLLEPSGLGAGCRPSPELAARMGDLRQRVVTAVGPAKRPLVRELEALELRAARESLKAAADVVANRITECLDTARSRDLFGGRRGIDAELRARLAQRRVELRGIRTARRVLERNHELPWFHYPSHFPDVFAAEGFDIVVGNPPWLRAEEIPRIERQRLAGRYRWWRGGGGYRNGADLSVAFVERAFELVRPDGVVAMLVPAKVASASYGASARHALASTTTLVAVADLTGHPDAAFDATVYPLAIVARRSRAPARHRVRISLVSDENRVEQASLRGGGPWLLTGGRLRRVLARLSNEHPCLGDSISCHLGVKTGANSLFLDPPHEVEAHLIRRAIRGRDIAPFRVRAPRRLLFPHDAGGEPLVALPRGAAAHLSPHLDALRRRADYAGGPPWTLYRVRAATARHRVVWADVARMLTAASLTSEHAGDLIPLNTCYVAVAASHAEADRIAAWLNCRWIRVAARVGAVPAAGGFARFAGNTIERLPLPASVLGDQRLADLAIAARDGAQVDDELDDLAADHLGLSAADRSALGTMVAGGAAHRR